jgi:hypothetical protein
VMEADPCVWMLCKTQVCGAELPLEQGVVGDG